MTSDDRSGTNDREYSNDDITVYWKPSKCIHVTTCYRELIEVFNPRKRPWIDMKGAPTDEIIRVVNLCPTGALSYTYNKDKSAQKEQPPEKETSVPPPPAPGPLIETEVRVMKDGPLIIKGKYKIVGSGGNEMKQMKIASFCRCGHSGKMPFCDGTHRKIGFKSD